MNKLIVAGMEFFDDEMKVTDLHLEYSPTGEELVVGSMSFKLTTKDPTKLALIKSIKYGDRVDLYRSSNVPRWHEFLTSDAGQLEVIIPNTTAYENFAVRRVSPTWYWAATFFMKEPKMDKSSKYAYNIDAFDIFGLLESVQFPGRFIPASETYTTGQILADIFSLVPNIPYTIDADVSTLANVKGFLPRQNARETLKNILFAYGISVKNTPNRNKPQFHAYLNGSYTAKEVDDGTYVGGSVQKVDTASRITVYEHSFVPDKRAEYAAVFDNASEVNPATNKTIYFDEPMLGYPFYVTDANGTIIYQVNENGVVTIDDGTWSRSSVDYLSWVISGKGVVYAIPYKHIETPIVWNNPTPSTESNEIEVKDNYIINQLNSTYVMDRLQKYYNGASLKESSFVCKDNDVQLPGNLINFTDAFGDASTGYIKEGDYTPSAIMKADSTVVTDWTPGPFGANITLCRVFDINDDGKTIAFLPNYFAGSVTFVLIGGGTGGTGGNGGDGGNGAGKQVLATGGLGGAAGVGGSAGKVYQVTIANPNPLTVTFHIGRGGAGGSGGAGGTGGAGGDPHGTTGTAGGIGSAGSAGTDTIINIGTQYSSASGSVPTNGYQNPVTGDILALPGEDGYYRGGDGGAGGYGSDPSNVVNGSDGEDVGDYNGGLGGRTIAVVGTLYRNCGGGGGGGGAAYSNPGEDGEDGVALITGDKGGKGGNGNTYAASPGLPGPYGSGGIGGSGGGGGGGGGATYENEIGGGAGGDGGIGGLGKTGADGCVLMFYKLA